MDRSSTRQWLVQAVLCADGIVVAPHLVAKSPDGAVRICVMDREVPATVFVNGCVVIASSIDAVIIIADALRSANAASQIIQKIDIAMKRASLYASGDAVCSVAVLVPFDGSWAPLII